MTMILDKSPGVKTQKPPPPEMHQARREALRANERGDYDACAYWLQIYYQLRRKSRKEGKK